MMNSTQANTVRRDTGVEWSVLLPAIAACTLTGCVLQLMGLQLQRAEGWAIAVGAVVFVFKQHSLARVLITYSQNYVSARTKEWLFPLLTIPATAMIVIVLSVVSPGMQASVLNRRLLRSLQGKDSSTHEQDAAVVLRVATKARVKLEPALVEEVVAKASQVDDSQDWSTFLAAVDYVVSNNDPNVAGDSRAGDTFDLGLNNSFRDVRLTGFKIAYHGGPLTLEKVTFRDCTFQVDHSENGKRFLEAVLASRGVDVTGSYR